MKSLAMFNAYNATTNTMKLVKSCKPFRYYVLEIAIEINLLKVL